MKKFVVGKDEHQKIVIIESGEYVVELVGEGGRVEIVGGWHLKGREELKIVLKIVHRAPRTASHTLLKAVVTDQAAADIRGKIVVEKQAQQADAFLKEAILLVSAEAKATAIPDLEIEANEVHCSHAVAVSRIDDQQIYYLTSRGMDRQTAEKLIIEGWLAETRV
jgi:Fe-S cluster assembly protein SufD